MLNRIAHLTRVGTRIGMLFSDPSAVPATARILCLFQDKGMTSLKIPLQITQPGPPFRVWLPVDAAWGLRGHPSTSKAPRGSQHPRASTPLTTRAPLTPQRACASHGTSLRLCRTWLSCCVYLILPSICLAALSGANSVAIFYFGNQTNKAGTDRGKHREAMERKNFLGSLRRPSPWSSSCPVGSVRRPSDPRTSSPCHSQ